MQPVGLKLASRESEKRKPSPAIESPDSTDNVVESCVIVFPCHLINRSFATTAPAGFNYD